MNVALQPDQSEQLAETFGLLSDGTRLSIVTACMDRTVAAGEIAEQLGLSASLVSHHLRLLRAAKMVRAERRGKQVFYTLADRCVRDVLMIMINHLFAHDHSGADDDEE